MLGTATAGTLLALFWYKITQPDRPDKDAVIFFAKLFYVGALVAILLSQLLRIR
jgi:hypothetical protein